LFLSLLLIIRSHIEAREFDWYANRVAFTANLRDWFFRAGAMLGVVMLVIAWVLPTGNADDNAQRFQNFVNNRNMEQIIDLLNKLFSSLDNQGIATADYYGGDTLKLGGAIQLGNEIVMGVGAPPITRYYWKSRIFDIYISGEWSSPRTLTEPRPSNWGVTYADNDVGTHQEVTQHFSILASTKLLYAAPQLKTVMMPVSVEFDRIGGGAIDPAVIRPQTALRDGDSYDVISSVLTADASSLRNTAGLPYPDWVKQRNLQVPPEISLEVRDLAISIVNEAGAVTPYDKAKAIERWLRANIEYRETPAQPPPNTELIRWTLFVSQQGYCTYYASAMVMMLRMIDIPARMAAGFAEGTYTSSQQTYLVQERDAHTWVEVYFPSIGWVEFEPTSAQQSLDRADPQVTTQTATTIPTDPPTATPTIAPTQGIDAPPTATPTVPPELEVTFTPTPSPTPLVPPSPTPTLTPTPLSPLSFLEVPPEAQGIFNGLFIIGGLLALLSFIGVGALWWVEYRGLDKLSPIGRAYARLRIYANWLKVPLHGAQTPLEQGRRIARDIPPSTAPVMKITDNYIVERYSPPRGLRSDEERQALQAWRKARRTFVLSKLRSFIPRWLRREPK
jgi:transglutaminase-like putative cysteine protease